MKCEHGNEIKVLLDMYSEHLEDGLRLYTKDGKTNYKDNETDYLRVSGCEICRLTRGEVIEGNL